ncbi:MAG: hypothetical protein IJ767_00260 [Bacteroidaceae bacterium]|nr:hypothetical protein [Bacteroidaceae bacterium]MBR1799918.1 hypothetical protein [Bacteroidaceae bacterium]
MKKISFFAVTFAALLFAACGGNKSAQPTDEPESDKTFEQEQIEASIKMNVDSLASVIAQLKQLPIAQKNGMIVLTEEERQVKPDYLMEAAVAENTTILSEKYRVLSAMQVDREVADLYGMSTKEYDNEIAKLIADINDPSFKVLKESDGIYEASQDLYNAMEQNGRINFYWQIVTTALVEQMYVISHNTDKFLAAFDDDAASNLSLRIILIQDALNRLTNYDPELITLAEAFDPLSVINAVTVEELKAQLAEAAPQIEEARTALVME